MKCLVLLLACLSAAVSIRLGYLPGKRYTYEYEAILAHGIPEAFHNDMAIRIHAKAHLDYLKDEPDKDFVYLRFENVVVETMKGELLTPDRLDWTVHEQTPDEEATGLVKTCLGMPVKFKFADRKVEEEIIAEQNDPEWCLNVKRALINHFYLPIDKDDTKTYQTQDEVTIAGKCTTAYTIAIAKPYYKLKRVINLAKCIERPDVLQHNIPNTDKFLVQRQGRFTVKNLPSFVQSAAYMHYDLKEADSGDLLIQNIVSEGEHDLTMLGDTYGAGKAVGARTSQTIQLLEKEKDIPKNAKLITTPKKCGGLMFVHDDGSAITFTPEAQEEILKKIKSTHLVALKELLGQKEVSVELPQTFTRLVAILRRCNRASLEQIFAIFTEEKNVEFKNVLMDAISRIGTLDAVKYIKELVQQGKIPEKYLGRALFGLGWIRNLNVEVMTHAMEICKAGKITANLEFQRACLLSFGNLLNRLMVIVRANPRLLHDTKHNAQIEMFARALIDGVKGNTNHEIKINYLKGIGNAGYVTDEVLRTVGDHVLNAELPLHVRIQAAWALRHMVRARPKLVRQYVLPIFANPTLDAELRITGYKIVTIGGDLTLHVCQFIGSVVGREVAKSGPRSNQVVSFIADDVRGSMNIDAYDPIRASRARLILRFIPRNVVFNFFAYSKAIKFGIGNGKPAMEVHINKVNGRDSFIPRHLGAKTKLHLPGLSADFLELGARMQGIHDILQPLMTPANGRQRRSIDVLNYIFGHMSHNEGITNVTEKVPARISAYVKMFGSEVFYGKLTPKNVRKILKDALFGDSTTTVEGITFSKNGIVLEQPFTQAHMLSEARYFIPTLTGIPLKISSKIGLALKGCIKVDVTGKPQLITSEFEKIKATVKVIPNVAVHMHNKISAWLPVFETGVIVKNEVLAQPKIHAVVVVTKTGVTVDLPTVPGVKKYLELKPDAHAVIRKEVKPGVRHWIDVDLVMKQRGMNEIATARCYGTKWFGIGLCLKAKYADPGFLRAKLLPLFPYYLLDTVQVNLADDEDVPSKIRLKYNMLAKTKEIYQAVGALIASGNSTKREARFTVNCVKPNMVCNMDWLFMNHLCPGKGCKATTTIDTSVENTIDVRHKHGGRIYNSKITFEEERKLMRMVNTWNMLPERIHMLIKYYHPQIIAWLRPYFSIDGVEQMAKRCEVRLRLHNRFTADIEVNAPTLSLRRINQELPVSLAKFPNSRLEIKSLISSAYGTCHVKGTNYIKTTDNMEIKQEIPCTKCAIVLAKDARKPANPKWKIHMKFDEQKQKTLIIVVKDMIFTVKPDLTVLVNGEPMKIEEKKVLPGVTLVYTAGKLFVQAEIGFQCVFDGSEIVVMVMPWWRNRVHGACGNNDGEQWTDMATPSKTFIPETLPREFIREWVVGGKACKKETCKLQPKHVELAGPGTPPAGHTCFTSGRLLQCMPKCKPTQTQTLTNVAHRCLPNGSALIEKILRGDKTVDLPNASVDFFASTIEHLACECAC